jgi:M6 family metalloprotease-like protein
MLYGKSQTKIKKLTQPENKITVAIEDKMGRHDIDSEHLLVAAGRQPNVENLALEMAGIDFDASGIKVDKHLRTTAKNIYAAGDVVPPYLFTHIAEYEAVIATTNACFPLPIRRTNYENILWCTYTDPELAHAGLTEEQARQKYGDNIKIYQWDYKNIDRAKTDLNSLDKLRLIIFLFIFILLLLSFCGGLVYAMPASPIAFEASQPDGRKIKLHIRGDEFFHWNEDTDGYTVVKDNGRFVYGELDINGRVVGGNLVVGVDNPGLAELKKRILPSPQMRGLLRLSSLSEPESVTQQSVAAVPPSGTVKNLVVLCMFSDHTAGVDTRDANDYDILFNQIGGDDPLAPTGSVKDLYLENSYGAMTLESTVVAWVTLPQTEAYYADGSDGTDGPFPTNAQGMVRDALELVDPLVDFSQFDDDSDGYIDSIDIIHSGYAAETGGGGGDWIWSHRWSLWQLPGGQWTSDEGVKVYDYHTEPALWGTSGTNIVRFGVIAHETGHFFRLPDLYDTDGSGEGIGSWGIMANSWGFDFTQLRPPHFCSWSKIFLGWLSPTIIDTPGTYDIGQLATNAQVYRIDEGYPSGEYLLIENRQPAGIESAIPQGGLCIFHIDDNAGYNTEGYPGQSGWPGNGNHYRVAVLQADGNYNLEKSNNRGDSGDVYHSGGISLLSRSTVPNTDAYQGGTIIVTKNTIANVSSAGSVMSFDFNPASPPAAYDMNVLTFPDTPITITLNASDEGLPNPPGALSYIITELLNHGQLSDPCAADINSVPYTLADLGNEVVYTPKSRCLALAEFSYKANDGGVEPNAGDSNEAAVTITIINTVFSQDFESGLGGFVIDNGFGNGSGLWQRTSSCSSILSGHTTPASLYFGLESGCSYDAGNTEGVVTSPTISLADITAPIEMELKYLLETEDFTGYDRASVEISENGGAFVELLSNYASTLSETGTVWSTKNVDISSMAGSDVQLRFRFRTVDFLFNNYAGVYVDDIIVIGNSPYHLVGDFEPDCDVDSFDFKILTEAWLSGPGDDNWCLPCDISDPNDDIINFLDFGVFTGNWLEGL